LSRLGREQRRKVAHVGHAGLDHGRENRCRSAVPRRVRRRAGVLRSANVSVAVVSTGAQIVARIVEMSRRPPLRKLLARDRA
jgi:hypothetical protein